MAASREASHELSSRLRIFFGSFEDQTPGQILWMIREIAQILPSDDRTF
jgi:hypothetical protein